MLGISTCWWHNRVGRGEDIIDDINRLGLQGVELEYRITEKIFSQIKHGGISSLNVLSVHNFFPKPEIPEIQKGSGDLFLLSSRDEEERNRAVHYSIRTLDHAQEMGAGAVVLHLGRVEMQNTSLELLQHTRNHDRTAADLQSFIADQRVIRKLRGPRNFDAVLKSLEKLNREAEKRGIFLAVENRYHFHEIPDFKETGMILKTFSGGAIRYWHDVGHAAAQEKLGIVRQSQWLEAYSENMIGVHIHDARGIDDHYAPGQGDIPFKDMMPHIMKVPNIILEVHPKVSRQDLVEGIQLIKGML
ncbi:MAG: sugar phosphate isomerase/epimerase [Deltaproteobacteria bacterium]|nr:sugar phosphate isomerase/epimerase [Deltaproteobacteria bacterium]